jgi:hypothetical protein
MRVESLQAVDWAAREWDPARFADGQFALRVPAVKWAYFAARMRPLADGPAAEVWGRLFAGVGRPFHYERAAGWMGRVFRRARGRPSDLPAGQTVADGLAALGWDPAAAALLVYPSRQVYAAAWADVLDGHRRGWVPLDTLVVCSPASSRVAVFWEGYGPYLADRGDRTLVG